MIVANSSNASNMAHRFSEIVGSDRGVRSLWFRQSGHVSEFWLVTDPLDLDHELQLQRLSQALYEWNPNALIDFHFVNLRFFPGGEDDAMMVIPAAADAIQFPR